MNWVERKWWMRRFLPFQFNLTQFITSFQFSSFITFPRFNSIKQQEVINELNWNEAMNEFASFQFNSLITSCCLIELKRGKVMNELNWKDVIDCIERKWCLLTQLNSFHCFLSTQLIEALFSTRGCLRKVTFLMSSF